MGKPAARARWTISDKLWEQMEPLLPPAKRHPLGCHNPATDPRRVMTGILFVLRTGCQWGALDATGICSKSTAHRWFMTWMKAGVFYEFWRRGLLFYDETKGIDWKWLSMDGAMTKAPLGGEKNRPQSDRPGETRDEAQRADRRERHPRWPRRRRRQSK